MLTPEDIEKLYNEATVEAGECPGQFFDFDCLPPSKRRLLIRFAALAEAKSLEEREALERRLIAWLRGGDNAEGRHMIREAGDGFESIALCWERADPEHMIRGMVPRVSESHEGEGPDYWQALRAALDEAASSEAKRGL